MKLNAQYVDRAARQFGAQALPEEHPATPKLNSLFGEHTFFIDEKGLKIVEPAAGSASSSADGKATVETARVVELAAWTDDTHTSLMPHERKATDLLVTVGEAA